jgi:hypothetical protein
MRIQQRSRSDGVLEEERESAAAGDGDRVVAFAADALRRGRREAMSEPARVLLSRRVWVLRVGMSSCG